MSSTTTTRSDALISLDAVSTSLPGSTGEELRVLQGIVVELHDGEIVALPGRSGSGTSTLLRTVAGLIAPTSGTVRYRGRELDGANPGVAMVFQSFALMPWLTVQDNVELGLAARGVPAAERRERALAAIDLIGLDAFESAYSRELSGGIRQRVGFARALVLEPDPLLMDEPFSALDVLTAENLRTELMSLWAGQRFPARSVCIVTHNIEEAVLLTDRVVVLEANPGRIRAEVAVDLPRPRDRTTPAFTALVDRLYDLLTGREPDVAGAGAGEVTPTARPLPAASVGGLAGLVELVHARGGRADLPDLAAGLSFEVDDLLPLVDAAAMLDLLEVSGADLHLTGTGRAFTTADIQESKRVFAAQAVTRAPLVRTVHRPLSAADGSLRVGFFPDLLQRGFSAEDARRQIDTAVDRGRYGELFDLDLDTGLLTLDASS